MARSRVALSATAPSALEALADVYGAAVMEVTTAIVSELSSGKRPERSHRADYSVGKAGMPTMSDNYFSRNGPFTYLRLLEPRAGDTSDGTSGRYPPDRFRAYAALLAAAKDLPVFAEGIGEMTRSVLEMQFGAAIDSHFTKFGEVAATRHTARAVSLPPVRALLETDLDIALIAPIALTRFDVNSMRLAPTIFLMRMSPELQRARWSGKAYGAKGHDSVLAAATHAFVVTGWRIDNYGYLKLSNSLSYPWANSTEEIDRIFAAFRLVTGIETGYAQEIRLARGWRSLGGIANPEVFAAPA